MTSGSTQLKEYVTMKISVLGTGMVGQNLSQALVAQGHFVMIGTRDVEKTLSNNRPNDYGMAAFAVWHENHKGIALGSYAEAVSYGDIIINATNGNVSIDALKLGRAAEAGDKILIDVANKLQPITGAMAKSLANDDTSLGEEIQAAFPSLRVVKTFNTMNTYVMTNPSSVAGDSTVFMSGNDVEAKVIVKDLLENMGWMDIIDLGDITGARGTEMMMPIWLRLWTVVGNTPFNFKIVR